MSIHKETKCCISSLTLLYVALVAQLYKYVGTC